jgi:hypothetical protein
MVEVLEDKADLEAMVEMQVQVVTQVSHVEIVQWIGLQEFEDLTEIQGHQEKQIS